MSIHPIGNKTRESPDARAEQLYQAGITAYKNGEYTQAHLFWQQSAHLNPKYRAVWLALYQVATDDADRITCLENAIRLNAKNPRIIQRLQDLQRRQRIMNGIPAEEPTPKAQYPSLWTIFGFIMGIMIMVGVMWLIVSIASF
jgi:tetratricopeptide (TPR) repeat protein